MRATCREVSLHGPRVECGEPLEVRSIVYLNTMKYGLMGNATVRYCRRQGMKYVAGLEFTFAVALAEEEAGPPRAIAVDHLHAPSKHAAF